MKPMPKEAKLTFEGFRANYRNTYRPYYQDPYTKHLEPFRIYGPLYYVGDQAVCVHLIDTGDGLLMIDAGFPVQTPYIITAIMELGFNPRDVKNIIITHGHYDHMGCAEFFQKRYGTRIGISRVDAELIAEKDDFILTQFCAENAPMFRAPKFDFLVEDGDVFTQGNISVKMKVTSGHTPGVLTFLFDVTENGRTLRAGLLGGVGIKMVRSFFLDHFDLPHSIQTEVLKNIEELKKEKVDIHLGNHPGDNTVVLKREKQLLEGGNPFIDPEEWLTFLNSYEAKIRAIIEEEANEA